MSNWASSWICPWKLTEPTHAPSTPFHVGKLQTNYKLFSVVTQDLGASGYMGLPRHRNKHSEYTHWLVEFLSWLSEAGALLHYIDKEVQGTSSNFCKGLISAGLEFVLVLRHMVFFSLPYSPNSICAQLWTSGLCDALGPQQGLYWPWKLAFCYWTRFAYDPAHSGEPTLAISHLARTFSRTTGVWDPRPEGVIPSLPYSLLSLRHINH